VGLVGRPRPARLRHRRRRTPGSGSSCAAGRGATARCGNGGLPDWIVARRGARTDDPAYLASARQLYAQIARQLAGLLWRDGGPVIGVQLENEYGGPAEHLLTLKGLARAVGLDVPLYTRTGWPALQTPLPFGEIIPLYGVYAEGFWDRELTAMPGHYWAGFHFSRLRTDSNIANEALGRRAVHDEPDVARYPYLTCEIGGGMMSSYHRRIVMDPRDIDATTLVKLGSGSNSPGYYMYHGGTNPAGRGPALMEAQDTTHTNWNDLPVKNYDFQAPLGAAGQIRPHYFLLRRLHRFLHAFGADLAAMDVFLPAPRPAGKDDLTTLRWAARSDGQRGFLFVNHHERGRELPDNPGAQFTLHLADGATLTFPPQPFTVPSGARFIWPFNLELGHGFILAWATAQPVTRRTEGTVTTCWFAATPGRHAAVLFQRSGGATRRSDAAFHPDAGHSFLPFTDGHAPPGGADRGRIAAPV
jgi:beta-galactosidase